MKTAAILLAAGKSERFGSETPKPFLYLGDKQIYQYSLSVFTDYPQIDFLILVVPKYKLAEVSNKCKNEKIQVVAGGNSRFQSVKIAVDFLDPDFQNILIHDAARPFVDEKLVDNCLKGLLTNAAVSCAIDSTDTLAIGKLNEMAESFPTRSLLKRIQTPQAFELSMLKKAYQLAVKEGKTNFTDDASILNHYQLADVLLVQGDEWNIKITTAIDLLLAEQILLKRNK